MEVDSIHNIHNRGMIANEHITVDSNSYEKVKTFKYISSLLAILLNIVFYAPMGRFQLELFIFIALFSEETSNPTRPVINVALTTKGLQERKHNIEWNDGGK